MKRSNFSNLLFVCLLFLSITFISSCKNDDDEPVRNSIVDVARANPNFSLLVTAITNVSTNTSTNVASLLSGPVGTKFTVFAPTNAAFEAASFNQAFLSNPANANAILRILQYHVLNGETRAADVPTTRTGVNTLLPNNQLFVVRNGSNVLANTVQVATADVPADNGVIHGIGTVLLPATGNIVATAQATPALSRLLAVIQYVDANTSPSANLATTLSGTGPFTVFAPSNDAFNFVDANSNGTIEASELQAVGATALLGILQRHVVASARFASDLGTTQASLNGNITIGTSGANVTVTNGTTATVTSANVLCSNGVVHVINTVLRAN
ncbi:MAG: fasciclin domain-containing protein [Microscillaceae bacterium]|jgi:uncharacterized surface protein with fasciclin (FAS1) repeats|nr:fasciclin domain-containing protein [Microscillaceae bacterium]